MGIFAPDVGSHVINPLKNKMFVLNQLDFES